LVNYGKQFSVLTVQELFTGLQRSASKTDTGIDLWTTVDGELQPNPQDFKIWDSEENKWHFVTVEDLRTGFEKALIAGQTHCGGYPLDLEDYDACFCDMVMQYAIFGELVYG
jgi:hypothetical protein